MSISKFVAPSPSLPPFSFLPPSLFPSDFTRKENLILLRTKAAMTERDGEPHKVDYTRVGFETLHFL